MILIDSNIIIYAINSSSPKNAKAQEFLQKNFNHLALAQQNILESFRVLTHPKFANPMSSSDAMGAIEQIAKVAQVISPDYKTISLTKELVEHYGLKGDQVFDAYLTATALTAGISKIATDNTKDFKFYEQITIINPFKGV